MKKKILWAAAHTPTEEQMTLLNGMGEVELLSEVNPALWGKLTKLNEDSNYAAIARELLEFINSNNFDLLVQPAGNPVFHVTLGKALCKQGIENKLMFSFSKRESEDIPQEDGSVKKVSIFKHLKWDKI